METETALGLSSYLPQQHTLSIERDVFLVGQTLDYRQKIGGSFFERAL